MCVQCVCVCVCVCVLLSPIFIIAVHLGNEVIFTRYHRWHHRPQYSYNATQAILSPSAPETVRPGVELNLYRHEWTRAWVGTLTNGTLTNWASRADQFCYLWSFQYTIRQAKQCVTQLNQARAPSPFSLTHIMSERWSTTTKPIVSHWIRFQEEWEYSISRKYLLQFLYIINPRKSVEQCVRVLPRYSIYRCLKCWIISHYCR